MVAAAGGPIKLQVVSRLELAVQSTQVVLVLVLPVVLDPRIPSPISITLL